MYCLVKTLYMYVKLLYDRSLNKVLKTVTVLFLSLQFSFILEKFTYVRWGFRWSCLAGTRENLTFFTVEKVTFFTGGRSGTGGPGMEAGFRRGQPRTVGTTGTEVEYRILSQLSIVSCQLSIDSCLSWVSYLVSVEYRILSQLSIVSWRRNTTLSFL